MNILKTLLYRIPLERDIKRGITKHNWQGITNIININITYSDDSCMTLYYI